MPEPSEVFDRHYKAYLARLADLDLEQIGPLVGGEYNQESLSVSYFNRIYRVSPAGILDRDGRQASYETCIILSRYLIMVNGRADRPDRGQNHPVKWTGFRDLKESGPLTVYFRDNAEQAISDLLAGHGATAARKLSVLGGRPPALEAGYDLALEFDGLPKVPMLLLFNDSEEGFPATCSVLFAHDVETWLDAECIAMMGYGLAGRIRTCMASQGD